MKPIVTKLSFCSWVRELRVVRGWWKKKEDHYKTWHCTLILALLYAWMDDLQRWCHFHFQSLTMGLVIHPEASLPWGEQELSHTNCRVALTWSLVLKLWSLDLHKSTEATDLNGSSEAETSYLLMAVWVGQSAAYDTVTILTQWCTWVMQTHSVHVTVT